jgi:hypothetical protein
VGTGLASLLESTTVPITQIDEQKKQEQALTAERNRLFRRLSQSPQDIHLAIEIKAIDDKIAALRSRK